ncbi:MAG TPA: shikimate kinase [Rhizomicrobium sp.]|jgi:shikimate kinase|nr:shikimate kinase [Rhizomicrobium sp.]
MKLTRSVALVGMMGAGKSSIGRRLATRLGVPFKDADSEIEHAAGCTVAEIFERYGEPAFRDGERKVIARLLTEPPMIIATGGGAYMDASTRDKLKVGAVTIWLRAPVDVLLARTARRDNRPLLKAGDPRATLERLMGERGPTYALADHTLDSQDEPHTATVERIVALLGEDGALAA